MLKENKIFFAIIIGALIISGFIYFAFKNSEIVNAPNSPAPNSVQDNSGQIVIEDKLDCNPSENPVVTKVIDGDTVVVEGGYHVRLLGMDADEKGYPCYDAAKTRLEELVLGKTVKLEKDQTNADQYGRCLRYIFSGDMNIDVQLVKEGLAVARFYAPDLKYKDQITAAENQAEENKTGCKWGK